MDDGGCIELVMGSISVMTPAKAAGSRRGQLGKPGRPAAPWCRSPMRADHAWRCYAISPVCVACLLVSLCTHMAAWAPGHGARSSSL
jgi:hypothetical protein